MAEIGRRFIIDGKSLYERYFPDFNRENERGIDYPFARSVSMSLGLRF